MEKNNEKTEKAQGAKTEKREMSNSYIAKQLLTNAKRLVERRLISEEEFNKIRSKMLDIIFLDLTS